MAEEDEKEVEEAKAVESGEEVTANKKGIRAAIGKTIVKIKENVNKSALLPAVLNATFWGFGYFYTGRRRTFGMMLMTSELLALAWLYLNPSPRVWRTLRDPLVVFSAVMFFLALAYDAYRDAMKEIEAVEHTQTES
jgi:hypothetical protein